MTAILEYADQTLYPVLPMRDVVLFPGMVVPLFVGRIKSMKAVDAAYQTENKQLLLLTQKSAAENDPAEIDLYQTGVIAQILQYLKLPDHTLKILVEAKSCVSVTSWEEMQPFMRAIAQPAHTLTLESRENEVLGKLLAHQFEQYAKLNKKINQDVAVRVESTQDAQQMSYMVASNLPIKTQEKQNLLEMASIKDRIERLIAIIEAEIDLLQVDQRIRAKVKKQMEKTQREYYLNEQVKAIQEELGQQHQEIENLKKQVEESAMSEEARQKALSEINRLNYIPPMSAEASVARNYIESLLSFPWGIKTKSRYNIEYVKNKLEKQHHGLEKVKERILEHLAVQKRVQKIQGPILLLVGPPGVGKTSLAQSIAEAIGRDFLRIALGGVRDEAEIRGHRRTYVGAMPGKIVQKIIKCGSSNPVILLDEIDKISSDYRGDPSSALLEVFDPEQNTRFNDHYLEVDLDLSDVMFITTANSLDIPAPLLDRMEVISLSGYSEDEKISIAEHHLIPKQKKVHGLKKSEIDISRAALESMISHYTLEAGVRQLSREIAKVCRKVVKKYFSTRSNIKELLIEPEHLEEYLGVWRYKYEEIEHKDRVGVVKAMAWTATGGDMLTIESILYPGQAKVTLTGRLGDTMQESFKAALSLVRAYLSSYGFESIFFEKNDIHLHVPQGATPKDGPSAGITMCVALLSLLTKTPVRGDLAMTGEITLRGDVLPIGGLKEKLLAARQADVKRVIIPFDNARDLKEIPDNIKEILEIHPVKRVEEAFDLCFRQPLNLPEIINVMAAVSRQKGSTEVIDHV